MIRLRTLIGDQRGASAAEYALVLPLLLIVLFGTIDVGRYAWSLNQAQKATQIGARRAVATDAVATGLQPISQGGYDFAVTGLIPQGTIVPQANFPTVTCVSNGTTASCACASSCSFGTTASNSAFTGLTTRMAKIYPGLTANNVVVTYSWSGLGFSGDPNGPQVAPLTTVSLRNLNFAPFSSFIFGGQVSLPAFAYSLPMEDGSGTSSN